MAKKRTDAEYHNTGTANFNQLYSHFMNHSQGPMVKFR